MSFSLPYSRKINKPVLIADCISGLLLVLFLYTALSKIYEFQAFSFVLKRSPLLHRTGGIIAIALPIVETGTAFLLFVPRTRLKGLFASLFLLSVFTIYLIYMIAFAPELPCSCGGVLKFLTWKQHIFFNLFFILLSLAGIFLYSRSKISLSSPPP